MIRENHQHLRDLEVSHASLEMIVAATAAEPFGLATKLTGAGGGGCAVTLIPDGTWSPQWFWFRNISFSLAP